MRKFMLFGAAALLCTVAIFAARASSAHAFFPAPGPDPGVAGGGYVLALPGPDVELNRVRFEVAIRQSQIDGSIRGKSLTMRAFGAFTCSVGFPVFCGTKYVSRSWTPTPYPGIPAPFGGGPPAPIFGCSMVVPSPPPGPGGFKGLASLFLVDPFGFEHWTGIVYPYDFTIFPGPDPTPIGDFIVVTPLGGPPLPMPLPFGPLTSGNLGFIDGVKSAACP